MSMTPKEKAEEIYRSFGTMLARDHNFRAIIAVKNCCFITIEQIISEYHGYRVKSWLTLNQALEMAEYWEEVKQEIEKL